MIKKIKFIILIIFSIINILVLLINIRLIFIYYFNKEFDELNISTYRVYNEKEFNVSEKGDYIPRSWLKKKYTKEEFETLFSISKEKLNIENSNVPSDLYLFYNTIKPQDEIWNFSSKQIEWDAFIGRSGYALVRDKKIICGFITGLN